MATVEVGSTHPQPDLNWVPVKSNQEDVRELGEFAVNKANRAHCLKLKFKSVNVAWKMTLANDYGNLYLLHLTAVRNTTDVDYQAVVWAKPKDCANDGWEAVSFQELSSASTA